MAVGAVRQITWAGALVRKICGRTARIGLLGFGDPGFVLSADFAGVGFDVAEPPHAGFADILCAAQTCTPERIAAHVRAGMLVVIDSGRDTSVLESILQGSGLQPGRDVFLCSATLGEPLVIRGATLECAKLGCALYLQVAASVLPSVRHCVDDVVDPYAHA